MSVFDRSNDDALVGLAFELSGGVGKMTGEVVGKAGPLYLIRRDGADHFELMELDDLRSARFFKPQGRSRLAPSPAPAAPAAAPAAPAPPVSPGGPGSPGAISRPRPAETAESVTEVDPDEVTPDGSRKRSLGDQIRRAVGKR